jgi:hypothetical protein
MGVCNILPGTGRGTTRSVVEGVLLRGSPLLSASSTAFGGPQFEVVRAPGTNLDCRGQSNLKLRAGEDL